MTTFIVIVAFLTLLALTAFVPKVQAGVQWLFRKGALVVYSLAVGIVYGVVDLAILVGLLVMGLIQFAGRLLLKFGNWALNKLGRADAAATSRFQKHLSNAHKRFG